MALSLPSPSPRLLSLKSRWSSRLARARELFPLTASGLLLGLGSGLALWRYGLQKLDLILLALGILGLVALALGLISVTLGALRLRLGALHEARPLQLETGRLASTGFSVPSLWWLPLARVDLRWQDSPAEVSLHRDGGQLLEKVKASRRGEWDQVTRRVEVFDPFGLVSITLRMDEPRLLRVVPDTGNLRTMPVLQGQAGGDEREHPLGPQGGDPLDMRRYSAGDPIRYVLWKLYARSGELMVRTPERAFAPVRRTVAYLVSGERDEPAAGAARRAVELGVLGEGWAFGADGCAEVARDPKEAMSLILHSSSAQQAQQGAGLGQFLANASPGGLSKALVFVPAYTGPWLKRVCSVGRSPGLSLDFVVCADEARMKPPVSRLKRWIWKEDAAEMSAPMDELMAVVRALSGMGKVTIVDRARGRVLPAEHLHQLEARSR